jgi:hypothetical protein
MEYPVPSYPKKSKMLMVYSCFALPGAHRHGVELPVDRRGILAHWLMEPFGIFLNVEG